MAKHEMRFTTTVIVVFSLIFLPPYRLSYGSSQNEALCAQKAAKIWLDYTTTQLLTRDHLAFLAQMHPRGLAELQPALELESIETVWKALEVLAANESAREKSIREAVDYLSESLASQKDLLMRVLTAHQKWTDGVASEKRLLEFTKRFTSLDPQKERVSTKLWRSIVTEKLSTFLPSQSILRYLGNEAELDSYLIHASGTRGFRTWLTTQLASSSEQLHHIISRGMEIYCERYEPSYPFVRISSEESTQIAIQLRNYFNGSPTDLVDNQLVALSVLDAYFLHQTDEIHTEDLASKMSQQLEKYVHYWALTPFEVREAAPLYARELIPLIYFLRSWIASSSHDRDHLSALILFDLFAQPPAQLGDILKNRLGIQSIINLSTIPSYAGYIRPIRNHHADWHSLPSPTDIDQIIAVILQIIYVSAFVTGLFIFPRWLKISMIIFGLFTYRP